MSGRQRGPDQLRGLLLTLVIFGHTYAAGVSEDYSKWIIYGFHMPLFFAISGWLLSRSSLTRKSVPEMLGYYWKRMLWQWLLVSVVFAVWKEKLPSSPKGTVDILIFEPLFHLWFIPALVIMVIITQVILRAGCGWWTLAATGAASFALFELPGGKDYIPESLTGFDHRYGSYFIWFLLGFAVRNATVRGVGWDRLPRAIVVPVGILVAGVGVGVYTQSFGGGAWQHDIGFALFNLGLISLLPAMLAALNHRIPLIGDAMSRVGMASLWIYLLHPFVTEYWRPHDDEAWRGRVIGALITIGIVALSVAASHAFGRRRSERSIDPPIGPVPGTGTGPGTAPPTQPIDVGTARRTDDEPPPPSPPRQDGGDIRRGPLTRADVHVLDVPDPTELPR